MASYYVYSGAAGSNNGSSWANAFTTLTTAFVTEAAGDTLYVAHDHAESTASGITLTSSGLSSNATKVVCVNRAGSVPPVSADRRATAQVTTTGTSNITFSGSGITHYDGIIFNAGTGSGSVSILIGSGGATNQRFDNCSFRINATGVSGVLTLGYNGSVGGSYVELNTTTLSFAATGQTINVIGILRWRNTPSALLGTIPTTLFTPTVFKGAIIECAGVDLSAAGSGKTIVAQNGSEIGQTFNFMDCKLNASVTKSVTRASLGSSEVDFVRSGSSGVNYNIYSDRATGVLTEETTIVRTGGASDGTTPIAWKIVTNGNATFSIPFACPPIAIWNDTTGSAVTATVEGIWGGGAVPNDNDIWVEIEYLGDASSPQASFVNDGTADLLTAAAGQSSSTETWGGSTTKFKLAATFTAQQKGWIYARARCAKAASTFYIDPLVTLT